MEEKTNRNHAGETTEDLKEQLNTCKKERDEYLAGWQRERADLANYKKGEMERFEELIKFANTQILLKILPLLDNLELAYREMAKYQGESVFSQGVLQVIDQFRAFLKAQGVQELPETQGKFNPEIHEAFQEVQVEGKAPGDVVEVVQKGYVLHGRVIRPAKVKVAK